MGVNPPTNETSKRTASHGRVAQHLGEQPRVPDGVARGQDRYVRHGRPQAPVAVEVEVGQGRLEPSGTDLDARPRDEGGAVGVVAPLGVVHQDERAEPGADRAEQVGVARRHAPGVHLDRGEPLSDVAFDRVKVGVVVVEGRDRRVRGQRRRGVVAAEPEVERSPGAPGLEVPAGDVDRGADGRRERRRPVFTQQGEDRLVVVGVAPGQPRARSCAASRAGCRSQSPYVSESYAPSPTTPPSSVICTSVVVV